jgi:catechol 2,3-dioxygenase-like lactoylglutathione lyase family enzyme
MMRIGHIELFVTDPARARKFYEDVLGFELVETQGERIVWLKSGDALILLRPGTPHDASADYQSARSGTVLYTDDLAAAMQTLRSRGLVFNGCDGSDACPTFTDPDGNWFQLVDPSDH